jgi:hypothetical protein
MVLDHDLWGQPPSDATLHRAADCESAAQSKVPLVPDALGRFTEVFARTRPVGRVHRERLAA